VDVPVRRVDENSFLQVVRDFAVDDFDGFVGFSQVMVADVVEISVVEPGSDAFPVVLDFRLHHFQRWHFASNDPVHNNNFVNKKAIFLRTQKRFYK